MIRFAGLSLVMVLTASPVWAACSAPDKGHVDLYPTGDLLPENLLRIYVYYPRPMKADEGNQNVRLLDDEGSPVKGAFLVNREDLWSPDRRRLTMILDPGRVKTGLAAPESLGRALVEGQTYTVEVSGDALDAEGCPLGVDTRHRFIVGAEDREAPDPTSWTIREPASGSTQPIIVELGSAHDHLSLAFRLRVLGPDGERLPGSIALGEDEARWEFTPRAPWASSGHVIAIEDSLEDLAGNRPGSLFDRPFADEADPWNNQLPFVPKP